MFRCPFFEKMPISRNVEQCLVTFSRNDLYTELFQIYVTGSGQS